MIAIIDYGVGNLGSVHNMFRRLGVKADIVCDPGTIAKADKLILPGVGAFDNGISNLQHSGLWEVLNKKVKVDNVPILGICLGMQLMSLGSEEGVLSGLGWIEARFRKFPSQTLSGKKLRIPNIGWNYIHIEKEDPLCKGLPSESRFYFVHSYYAELVHAEDALMACNYEDFNYICAYRKGNVWGVQFHPEKSHAFGMKLLKNFAEV